MLGFTIRVHPAGSATPLASWRRDDVGPLFELADGLGVPQTGAGGYPYRWTFPAGTFSTTEAAGALGADEPLQLDGDVLVEAWDES
jgi:hypothetical protein